MIGWTGGNPPTLPFTLNCHSPQARGLVGWWPALGQDNPELRRDYSGHHWHLRQGNSPTLVANAPMGQMGSFVVGSSQYYQGASSHVYQRPITLTAWATLASSNTGSALWVGDAASGSYYASCYFATTPTIGVLQRSTTTVLETASCSLNTLYFVAARIASSTSLELFVNGRYVSVDTTDSGANNLNINAAAIGRFGDSSPSFYHDGLIGDVRLYNRLLSDAEIWQLYNPATRWDLYQPIGYFTMIQAAALGNPWYHYLQQAGD